MKTETYNYDGVYASQKDTKWVNIVRWYWV